MKLKKLLALGLAAAMTMSMAACGGGNEGGNEEAGAKEEAGEAGEAAGAGDGVIDVCFASEPQSIDPALNSAVDGAVMLQHAFEGLIKWVDDGEGNATLAPGMAEKWDISEDKLTYTFHLRKDAVWSDGEPVTANDFLYAWNRLADPTTAADYSYMLDPVVGYDSTKEGEVSPQIEAPDENTFVVHLDVPTAYFEELCAFPALFPVREDIIEANGDQWTFSPETYVSNGPYKMTSWEHNAAITMEKRDDYYAADEITNPSVKFHLMDDANAMLASFRSGELDFIQQAPPEEVPGLLESGELGIKEYIGTYYVCFQTQKAPFDDPKVREAFSLAIDRDYICEQVKGDGSVVAGGFVPAGMYDAEGPGSDFRKVGGDYYDPTFDAYEANCEKARELLAEAGYPEGKDFPVVEYLYNTDDGHKAIAEALQNMWQTQLGVQVTLNNQDWNVFLETRKNGDYSIARNGWIADYNDPMCFLDMWVTGGGNNDAQYANPAYDELIGKAKASSDNAERMQIMHDAEDLLIGEEKVLAPLYFYVQTYMDAEGLEGWYYTPLGYFFFGNAQFK